MTHDDLVLRAEKWLKNSINCGVVFNDKFQAWTSYGEQPDGFGLRAGVSVLIECKASRADFHADKKKRFRADPSLGMGDWRFYMCPKGVINVEDLPEGWGLLWVNGSRVEKVHGIPPNTQWSRSPFSGNKDSERAYMYGALRRLTIRGRFSEIYEGIPKGEQAA
tara:strand:+ start:423 stop:914 length:492 start_codon:yes stop_codon:yes gene_type:complete